MACTEPRRRCTDATRNAPTVTTTLGVYIGLFAVVGLPGGVYYAGVLGMVQQRVPAGHLGRALGSFCTASNGAQAIGMAPGVRG